MLLVATKFSYELITRVAVIMMWFCVILVCFEFYVSFIKSQFSSAMLYSICWKTSRFICVLVQLDIFWSRYCQTELCVVTQWYSAHEIMLILMTENMFTFVLQGLSMHCRLLRCAYFDLCELFIWYMFLWSYHKINEVIYTIY